MEVHYEKILLACNAGLSTSMLVQKMKDSAEERKIDVEILAVSVNSINDYLDYDVLLLGPQVRFLKDNIAEKVNMPVIVIDTMDYGMLNGTKVLDNALAEMKGE